MNWKYIISIENLNLIDEESKSKPILIYKHSTSCSLSSMTLSRLETKWKKEYEEQLTPYFLNLIQYRNVSNEIAKRYDVIHESPQILIISNGKCTYDNSHNGIRMDEILQQVEAK